ncbi:MAG: allophanate hydrolase [Pseudomonadota bacterium]
MSAILLTLPDWRRAYRDGASPRQLLAPVLQRLRSTTAPEAWITLIGPAEFEAAIAALEFRASRHADRTAALRAMPLFGVPFAVKDNIDVAGLPTTAACPAFARTPTAHAHAVAKLIAAGAVCMGKTNLDQFATGLVGARSPYGRPSSAFAAERISGGSSSGSAVVVARGEVAFALGTDTAGSGRVPAGFNNLVGLKPTPGRVSSSGVVPACRSLDCISVLALTVADAAEVLAVMEGADATDAWSAFRPGAATFAKPALRIGVPAVPVIDGAYAPCFEQALAQARALGHTVVPIDFAPLLAVAKLLYGGPWVAERHAVVQALMARDPGALDPTVRRVIEVANQFSATDAFRAQYVLRDAQRDTAALWNDLDLLMVPTAPTHPTHTDIDADPLGANALLGTYTNFVNLLGWCALALPAGFTASGLPFGVTLIAPGAADAALARVGLRWEASVKLPLGATGRAHGPVAETPATEPPAAWPASRATLPIAVVGAHLSGLPLNGQLTERGATLREATTTAPHYRLFALPNTTPPKPGLQRASAHERGAAIAVEVWDMPLDAVGSFLALIPPPLGLGSLELADGRHVHGFVCEAHALVGARDITAFGGWRAFLASAATP